MCACRRNGRGDLGFPAGVFDCRWGRRRRSGKSMHDRRDEIHHQNEKREKEEHDRQADYREYCTFRYHLISPTVDGVLSVSLFEPLFE